MRWAKLGRIFAPAGRVDWMASHAALPVAVHLRDDLFRVFCSGRDAQGRAQVGFFELALADPTTPLTVSPTPSIGLGPLGAYDDRGVTSSWIVAHGGQQYHYFTGWSLGVTVPFYLFAGLATSTDGGITTQKVSSAPILARHAVDPYLTASPCVLRDGGTWRMWYVSGTGWTPDGSTARHSYHVKYAESDDGIVWRRQGVVCIDYRPGEHAIARPCVLRHGTIYRMWYCYRGAAYRIGYAESADGLRWERHDDEAGIGVSAAGWDSEMVAYPYVFEHGGRLYMLYNGNDYGRTGVGLAVLVD